MMLWWLWVVGLRGRWSPGDKAAKAGPGQSVGLLLCILECSLLHMLAFLVHLCTWTCLHNCVVFTCILFHTCILEEHNIISESSASASTQVQTHSTTIHSQREFLQKRAAGSKLARMRWHWKEGRAVWYWNYQSEKSWAQALAPYLDNLLPPILHACINCLHNMHHLLLPSWMIIQWAAGDKTAAAWMRSPLCSSCKRIQFFLFHLFKLNFSSSQWDYFEPAGLLNTNVSIPLRGGPRGPTAPRHQSPDFTSHAENEI